MVLATIIACNNPSMELTILDRQILKDVASASGIAMANNEMYVIGDNTPWIFKLNNQFQVSEKQGLLSGIQDSIIPKKLKPDFEAMTSIQSGNSTQILVFGSGSRSPQRDILVRFYPDDSTQTKRYSLEKFYSHIKSSTSLDSNTLNIEGATASGNRLYLFNRGKNIILQFNLDNFISYLEGNDGFPPMKEYIIQLPVWNEMQATFSGASFMPDTNDIVFTASLENNLNPIADGKIFGSYVGIIHTDALKNGYRPDCVLITEKNEPLKIKVESVEVLTNKQSGQSELLLVTDSDGGVSEFIRVKLLFN